MTLRQFLAGLDPPPSGTPADGNLSWLRRRLDEGDEAIAVTPLEDGFPGCPGAALLVEIQGRDESVTMPIGLDAGAIAFVSATLGHLLVPGDDDADDDGGSNLVSELRSLFRKTADAPPDERAGQLMDWIMDRTAATRCALIPFESGTPGMFQK